MGGTCLPLQVMQCVEEFLQLQHRPPLLCSATPPVVAGTAPQSDEGPFQTKLTCKYVHKHTEHFVVCSLMKARGGVGSTRYGQVARSYHNLLARSVFETNWFQKEFWLVNCTASEQNAPSH